jgi:hypothetical protein
MDINAIRLQNLELLIEEFDTAAEVAKRSATDPSYLSQVRRKSLSRHGKERGIGDDLARRLESGCQKPVGWMDRVHEEVREDSPKYADSQTITLEVAIEVARTLKGQLQQDWLDANTQEAGNMLYLLIKAYRENRHGRNSAETGERNQSVK